MWDPVVLAQLAGLFRRGLVRHRAREQAGELEPSEIRREREEIRDVLLARRRDR